jgi:hypothetical protein
MPLTRRVSILFACFRCAPGSGVPVIFADLRALVSTACGGKAPASPAFEKLAEYRKGAVES